MSTTPACLLCGSPTCSEHPSPAFRKEKVTLCTPCVQSSEFDFEDDSNNSETLTKHVDHLVDLYDRAVLLLQYSSQFMLQVAVSLEESTKHHNKRLAPVGRLWVWYPAYSKGRHCRCSRRQCHSHRHGDVGNGFGPRRSCRWTFHVTGGYQSCKKCTVCKICRWRSQCSYARVGGARTNQNGRTDPTGESVRKGGRMRNSSRCHPHLPSMPSANPMSKSEPNSWRPRDYWMNNTRWNNPV